MWRKKERASLYKDKQSQSNVLDVSKRQQTRIAHKRQFSIRYFSSIASRVTNLLSICFCWRFIKNWTDFIHFNYFLILNEWFPSRNFENIENLEFLKNSFNELFKINLKHFSETSIDGVVSFTASSKCTH